MLSCFLSRVASGFCILRQFLELRASLLESISADHDRDIGAYTVSSRKENDILGVEPKPFVAHGKATRWFCRYGAAKRRAVENAAGLTSYCLRFLHDGTEKARIPCPFAGKC